MELSIAHPPYIIPSYSLTGDLLAYLKCGLQYRYTNKGSLPPSRPVQLWFGEFIHAVMEEAYLGWAGGTLPSSFPWDWGRDIRPIELEIARRLEARGLRPAYRSFCAFDLERGQRCTCPGGEISSDHRLIASRRADTSINIWGPHLFPLISHAEMPLQAVRPMTGSNRADYFEVTGIADVIGSVLLANAPQDNLLLQYLGEVDSARQTIRDLSASDYEIILDYKGTRRPSITSYSEPGSGWLPNQTWEHYRWQVLTYAWLRSQQRESSPVAAGILLFLNELEPSATDMVELRNEVVNSATDVMPSGRDRDLIVNWNPRDPVPQLSTAFRERRSIMIVAVEEGAVHESLQRFDGVVAEIEQTVGREMAGEGILGSWQSRPTGRTYVAPERRTCTACDFKHYCPLVSSIGEGGIPLAP